MTLEELYKYKVTHEQSTGKQLNKIWLIQKDIVELMVECNKLVRLVAPEYSVPDNFVLFGVEVRQIEFEERVGEK